MCGPIAPTKFDLEQGWGSHGQWFRRIIVAVDRRSRKFFNLSVIRDIDGYHLGHSAVKETSVKSSKAYE